MTEARTCTNMESDEPLNVDEAANNGSTMGQSQPTLTEAGKTATIPPVYNTVNELRDDEGAVESNDETAQMRRKHQSKSKLEEAPASTTVFPIKKNQPQRLDPCLAITYHSRTQSDDVIEVR